jgi:hypothetical protein
MTKYLRPVEVDAVFYKADGSNANEIIEWAKELRLWAALRSDSSIIDVATIMRKGRHRGVPFAVIGEPMSLSTNHWFVLTECRSFEIYGEDQFENHFIPIPTSTRQGEYK